MSSSLSVGCFSRISGQKLGGYKSEQCVQQTVGSRRPPAAATGASCFSFARPRIPLTSPLSCLDQWEAIASNAGLDHRAGGPYLNFLKGTRRPKARGSARPPCALLATGQEAQAGVNPGQDNGDVVIAERQTSAAAWEAEEERRLRLSEGGAIAGIPRHEWVNIQQPTRYLGNEFGAVHKDWASARVRFSLTYPETYEIGASNMGHVMLYTLLNQEEGMLCDRSYMPGPDMGQLLRKYEIPLFAVESKRSLASFDALGFSLAYELGATNILEMLALANIPVSWKERQEPPGKKWDVESGSWPLIFAGGPTATSNPEPFSDFFDFFALGDGEDCLPEIGRCLDACKAEGLSREETLFRLCTTVKGVYVPQFYDRLEGFGGAVFPVREGVPERVVRRVAAPNPFLQIGLVPYVETIHDRLTVEIRRGCTRGCRFCQPGMLTRPARDVPPEDVVKAVEDGMRRTGYNEFSLLSLSCSDYLALPAVGLEIKNRLKDDAVTLALPSQRVDRFDDNIANIVGGTRTTGLTFAPEGGTQRMRDIINKGLTNEELLRGVKTAWDRGWKQVKLYFMIGLPGETDADVLGIAETVQWLQTQCRDKNSSMAFKLTVSNFTPKPHTPFQWHSQSTSELHRKQGLLKAALRDVRGVTVNYTTVELSAMEDFISRGDRRLGAVILRAWELGATNDGWWLDYDSCYQKWNQAIIDAGMDWKYRQVEAGEWNVLEKLGDGQYRGQGGGGKGRLDRGPLADQRLDMPLPWDIVDTGITKWWLKTDLQRALEAATVPDCSHSGLCSECGVCGDDFGENVVAEVPPIPVYEGHKKPNSDRVQRLRVHYGKLGSMVYVGHLDLQKLFERALRRAALPVSYDSGFHALPRIAIAKALQLGASSTAEVVDIELYRTISPAEFRLKLEAQLPEGLPIYGVEDIPMKRADKKFTDSIGQLMRSMEHYVVLQEELPSEDPETGRDGGSTAETSESASQSGGATLADYQGWVEELLAMDTCMLELAGSKFSARKGRRKAKAIDARKPLFELEALPWGAGPKALWSNYGGPEQGRGVVTLRYVSQAAQTEPGLTPAALVKLMAKVSKRRLVSLHVHRSKIGLAEPSIPQVDTKYLAFLCRDEAHSAAYRQFDGTSRIEQPGWPEYKQQSTNVFEAAARAREMATS